MREIKPRTKQKETSRQHQQRVLTEAKYTAKQQEVIDTHDLLHSIFWNKPTREEMKQVFASLNAQLLASKVNMMQSEIDELVEEGLVRLPRGEQ